MENKKTVGQLFLMARGANDEGYPDIPRSKVLKRAKKIPGCPIAMNEQNIRRIEEGNGQRADGNYIRYLSEAMGISLVRSLEALDLWPPVVQIDVVDFMYLCKSLGLNIAHVQGNRLIIDIPKRNES